MYKDKLNQQATSGITRRAVMQLLGLAVLAKAAKEIIPEGYLRDKLKNALADADNRYFRAVKIRDNVYVEFQGKVFEIEKVKPVESRGIQYLVSITNPSYNRGELKTIGELSEQLYNNPMLENLKNGEVVGIPYNPKKIMGFLQPYTYYPIPKEIGDGSLEVLVMKK